MAGRKRTTDERLAEVDSKIVFCKNKIDHYQSKLKQLEEKRENILNPKPRKRKASFNSIAKLAKEQGMTLDEFATKLGIDLE